MRRPSSFEPSGKIVSSLFPRVLYLPYSNVLHNMPMLQTKASATATAPRPDRKAKSGNAFSRNARAASARPKSPSNIAR